MGESPRVAVTNLNFRTHVDDIYHVFSKFGEMTECRLVLNERNESKGYGFISYKKTKDAQRAIHEMNGFHLDSKEIRVEWATNKNL